MGEVGGERKEGEGGGGGGGGGGGHRMKEAYKCRFI